MATKTWSAAADGNWDVDGNWSGGAKPAAGDDIVFDNTSVKNCTVDVVPANIGSMTIASTYTGTIDMGTISIVCLGSWTFGANATITPGTSTVTFNGTLAHTITSNGKSFYDVTINNTATNGTTFSGAVDLHTLTISGTNTQTVTWSGTTLTASGDVTCDGSGIVNMGTGLTMTGASKTLHVHSTVSGSSVLYNCSLDFKDTGTIDIDRSGLYGFKNITMAYAGKTVDWTNAATDFGVFDGGVLTLGTGTLTLSGYLIISALVISADVTPIVNSGATINGTQKIQLNVNCRDGTKKINIPAMTLSGSGSSHYLSIYRGSGGINREVATVNFTGNITTPYFYFHDNTNLNNLTIDTNGYNLTVSNDVSGGCDASGVATKFYLRTGTHSFGSFGATAYNVGTNTLDLGSSTITCTGSWTYMSSHSVTVGTSVVTFNGTAAHTITSAGKSFYDVTISNTATNGTTFSGNVDLHTLNIAAANTQAVTWSGYTLTASGDVTCDGSGTLNVGNGITMSGASGTAHFDSTLGTVTASSCDLTMNGTTGMTLNDNKAVTLKSLILGASAIVTHTGSAITYVGGNGSGVNGTLNLGNSSTLTLSGTGIYVTTISSTTPLIVGTSVTINGTKMIDLRLENTAVLSVSIPAMTFSGTTGNHYLLIKKNLGAATGTVDLAGNFQNTNAYGGFVCYSNTVGDMVFNTNNYSILCPVGEIILQNKSAANTATFNLGSSTITCLDWKPEDIGATTGGTYNMGSASITCARSWWWEALHTVNPQTSTVTFTGTGSITSNGKAFNSVTINCVANTVTLSDALTCNSNFIVTTGSLASANFAMGIGGNFTFAGAGTINLGTSIVTCSGNGNVTFAAGPTYTTSSARLVLQADHTVTIGTGVSFDRLLTKVAGQTITWNTGANVFWIKNYTAGDIGVAAGAQVMYRSSTPGTYYLLRWPIAGITVTRMDFQDMSATVGTVTANDGSSQTRGHNLNLVTFNTVSIVPNNGTAAGGTAFTLTDTGNGFGGTCTVQIGAAAAVGETVVDTQHLTAVTGAGAVGPQNVLVTNGDGDTYTILGGYTYNAIPAGGYVPQGDRRPWIGIRIGI